jgi:hypothetical protein
LPFCYLVNPLQFEYNKSAISTPIPGGEKVILIDEANPANSAVFNSNFYNVVKPEWIINIRVVCYPQINTLTAFASVPDESISVSYAKKLQFPVIFTENFGLDTIYITNTSTNEINRTFAKGVIFEINLSGADFLNMEYLDIEAPDFLTGDQKKKLEVQTTILDYTI